MSDRLLLIADECFDSLDALPDDLCQLVAGSDHVHVVAPTTGTRLETLTEDDAIYEDAIARANRVADLVREQGGTAEAHHSQSAPLETALAALRTGDHDAVAVITTGDDHWREDGLLDDLRDATDHQVHAVSAA